ncbi:hypothetical protein Golax_005802, partial [Gossypium laxum]|nr:hypothetical protein [Gossypium laxum]
MRPSGYGLRRHNKRNVIAQRRDISQNYGISLASLMSMWINTHSELWPSIGIPRITALLLERIQTDKAYFRAANVPTFLKKLMILMGMSEQRKRVDVFALSIYGLVIFPKALGHIDDVVSNLLNRLDKRVIPILAILAETFRSLSACRIARERRFIGCAQLFLAWFYSHFWRVEKSLQDEDVEWRASWMIPDKILYRYRDFDWVPSTRDMGSYWIHPYTGNVRVGSVRWEKKFQDTRVQEDALERDLLESQNEKVGLRARAVELEWSLHRYSSRNSLLEMNNEHWKEQLQCSQGLMRDRDHIMGEAVTQ